MRINTTNLNADLDVDCNITTGKTFTYYVLHVAILSIETESNFIINYTRPASGVIQAFRDYTHRYFVWRGLKADYISQHYQFKH